MSTVHVLTNNSCPNSRAFNCPLLAARGAFRAKGVELKFHYRISPALFTGSHLWVNSNFFRPWWRSDRTGLFAFLDQARAAGTKIFWFDTTDSTWSTQFPVLPKVDLYLKSQLFADLGQYHVKYRSGRVFTDYFDQLYQSGEDAFDYELPDPGLLQEKARLSWNTCFENYTESRYGWAARLRQRLRPHLPLPEHFAPRFTRPELERPIPLSCRLGTTYSRPSVAAHRRAIIAAMARRGVDCGKLPLDKYFAEMRSAGVGIGPFGVGEITLRDFEIILCGCALVKPDFSHLRTWPELFVPGETCAVHRWDLSDLDETLDKLLSDWPGRVRLARSAQERYQAALSPEGMVRFAARLLEHMGRT